jgi:hypothetical protein
MWCSCFCDPGRVEANTLGGSGLDAASRTDFFDVSGIPNDARLGIPVEQSGAESPQEEDSRSR